MSSDDIMARNIIVDGLPQNVVPEKRDMFQRHMKKKVSEVLGHSNFNIHLLIDNRTALVSGAFISFGKISDAENALARLNLYHFTKTDILKTYRWSALKEINQISEVYQPPEIANDDAEEDGSSFSAHSMLDDAMARPQFFTKGGLAMDVEWYYFNWEKNEPQLFKRPKTLKNDSLGKWSEMDRQASALQKGIICSFNPVNKPLPIWSTFGTMVVSQHHSGLKIWGGREMHLLFEIPDTDIKAFMISPEEKYMVVKTAKDLSIWNLHTAKKIRTLGNLDLNTNDLWPIMRFSADDSLVAVSRSGHSMNGCPVTVGKLSIYSSNTMRLFCGNATTTASNGVSANPTGNKLPTSYTFAVNGLYKAEWNPKVGTQLAIAAESGNTQGWCVTISNVRVDTEENTAEQEILIQRNFLQATKLEILWHPSGTHLAVKVIKACTEYFLFQINARSVSVIQLQIEPGYSAARFAWKPSGEHFAVILEKNVLDKNPTKVLGETSILCFYSLKGTKLKLIQKVSTSSTNLFWAPKGSRLVGANFDKSLLQFFNINDNERLVELEKVTGAYTTDCQWDPTGRFFATWVSSLRDEKAMAAHYRIYDVNGQVLFQKDIKSFSHFAWRPLPPSLLSDKEVQEVRAKLKEHMEAYESERLALEDEEKQKTIQQNKEKENVYKKKMELLLRKADDEGLAEQRKRLIHKSIWANFWTKRIARLPKEKLQVEEDIIENRITSRRQV